MTTVTREQLLDTLENGWGTYVQRFLQLSPEEQTEFLQRQGYPSLKDLLAHVIGWWEEGIPAVNSLLKSPTYQSPEVDVDGFNAASVERYRSMSEQVVIARFEALRQNWIKLIKSLPEQAFNDERIRWRLYVEIIGHLEEHAMKV